MIRLSEEREGGEGNSCWSLLGRRVLSRSGVTAGRVVGFYLRGRSLDGFLLFHRFRLIRIHHGYFANLEELEGKAALLLKVEPVHLIRGLHVYDHHGRKLGRVHSVQRKGDRNEFDAVMVQRGYFSSAVRIPRERMEVVKKSILLKESEP